MGSRGVPVEDGSRIETEYAGEYAEGYAREHVAEPAPGPTDEAAAHIAGHPPNPNAGVVPATPPGPGALLVAAGVAALTLLALVLLALKVS